MPIYGYRCGSCGHEIDVVHAIDALGPTTCTVCGGAMRKMLSTPAIHFRGSGWAKKDASASTSSGRAAAKAEGEQASGAAGEVPATSGSGASGEKKGQTPAPAAVPEKGTSGTTIATPTGSARRAERAGKGDSGRGGRADKKA
jgi:putative FmdB family regulatory protein